LPTDFLSVSQQDIKNNFSQANATMDVNHFPFNDLTANNGKHKSVVMPISAPKPTTSVDESALYTKDYNALSNLYYRPENTAVTEILMTNNFVPVANANGYTFLPGGMVLLWFSFNAAGTAPIYDFSVNPPNFTFTTVFQASASLATNQQKYGIAGLSTTQIQIFKETAVAVNARVMIIGLK
jgi:hypothetical protein